MTSDQLQRATVLASRIRSCELALERVMKDDAQERSAQGGDQNALDRVHDRLRSNGYPKEVSEAFMSWAALRVYRRAQITALEIALDELKRELAAI